MSIRIEIIDCAAMGTTSRITVANLPTEENIVHDENDDFDTSDLLELVEDQYSRDVFENEVEDDNKIDKENLVATENEYIKNVFACSGLHVIQQNTVLEAYTNRGPVGLFHQFSTKQFFTEKVKHGQTII